MTSTTAIGGLFDPASIAVVGATDDLSKPGGRCLQFLQQFGYRGTIYPINPKYEQIGELRCYPALDKLPGPADLVVLLVPAAAVPRYLDASAAAGARAAIICSSGFAEAGDEGVELQQALVAAAERTGLAVLGPNSLGLVDLHHSAIVTFSTAMQLEFQLEAGPIAFLSQSGAMGAIVFALAQSQRIPLGKFISSGNEAVLDFADILEYLAGDADVRLIMGYIEGIRRGRRFINAARKAHAAGKRVAVVKVGTSEAGVKAARSHTGALVGSAQVYDAAFRRAGVLGVGDVRSLLHLASALPIQRQKGGPRVSIASFSGGAAVMMADRCSPNGLAVTSFSDETLAKLRGVLPAFAGMANPVDLGAVYGNPETIEAALHIIGADPNVDMQLFFMGLSPLMAGVIESRLAAVQERSGKPVIVAWMPGPPEALARLRSLGIAAFDDPGDAVDAAGLLARAALPLPAVGAPEALPDGARALATRQALEAWIAAGRDTLTEREVKALLVPYGVPVVQERLATSPETAEAAARELGGRLAIKAEAPQLLHKSDAGAVRLGVTVEGAREAYSAVVSAAAKVVGAAGVNGAVIARMAPAGLEVLVGLKHDPQFGPTLTVGLGGVLSEALADVATELAPVDRELALAMLSRLRAARLFGAFRGSAARDLEAVAAMLVALGQFALDAGDLLPELDLNPVIVHPAGEGCTVVDGAAVLKRPVA